MEEVCDVAVRERLEAGKRGRRWKTFGILGSNFDVFEGDSELGKNPNWAEVAFVPRGTFPCLGCIPKMFHVEQI
jgi:hypothetical protein